MKNGLHAGVCVTREREPEWRSRRREEPRSRQVFKWLQIVRINCRENTCEVDLEEDAAHTWEREGFKGALINWDWQAGKCSWVAAAAITELSVF